MITYPKINSIFKRDLNTGRFTKEYSTPEIAYLANAMWTATEKIDGTNIRIGYDTEKNTVEIGGRTANAQIPADLFAMLHSTFTPHTLDGIFDDSVILFGEGIGPKINKGSKYSDTPSFILFDVLIGHWWLQREMVDRIAHTLNIRSVPTIQCNRPDLNWPVPGWTLEEAVEATKRGMTSHFGDFIMEGMVLTTSVGLLDRSRRRIITKVKHRDFK